MSVQSQYSSSSSIQPPSTLCAQSLPVSKLQERIIAVFVPNEQTPASNSTAQKIMRYSLYGVGAGASTISCVIPARISLSYPDTHPNARALGEIGVGGIALTFDLFGTWGYVILVRELMQGGEPEYQVLFKNDTHRRATWVKVLASTAWGSLGRLPSAGSVIQFNHSIPWAIATMVGGAGPNIFSCFQLLSLIERQAYKKGYFATAEEAELEKHRDSLLTCFSDCKQMVLNMSQKERGDLILQLQQISEEGGEESLGQIFSPIRNAAARYRKEFFPESPGVIWSRRIAVGTMCLPASLLLLQSLFLANTGVAESYIPNSAGSWSFAVIAAAADAWITFHVHQTIAKYATHKFAHLFNKSAPATTFAETFYPRVGLLLDMTALAIALMPFAELVSVGQQCAERYIPGEGISHDILSNGFVYGGFAGWTVLLFQAVEDLIIENGLRGIARSRFGGEDAHCAAQLLDKMEIIELLIQRCNPEEFRKFLVDLPTEEEVAPNAYSPLLGKDKA